MYWGLWRQTPMQLPPVPNPTCVCRAVLPVPGPAVTVSEQGQGHCVGTATERWQSRGSCAPSCRGRARSGGRKREGRIAAKGVCVFWGQSPRRWGV